MPIARHDRQIRAVGLMFFVFAMLALFGFLLFALTTHHAQP